MTVKNDISRFPDRKTAGARLADELAGRVCPNSLVMATSVNGMDVAFQLAQNLELDYDLLIHEHHLCRNGRTHVIYRNTDARHQCGDNLESEYERYTGSKETQSILNRTVILTDEGLESPDTLIRCIKQLKKEWPNRIVLALPVAPAFPLRALEKEVHELICLITPVNFISSHLYYDRSKHVSPEEIRAMFNLKYAA